MLQRGGAVSGPHHSNHQLDSPACVEREESRKPLPEVNGRPIVAHRLRRSGDVLQRGSYPRLESLPLSAAPALDLGAVRDEETIEKWSPIKIHCSLEIAAVKRLLKFADVARNPRFIEPDIGSNYE
jgi:hypothetical protein